MPLAVRKGGLDRRGVPGDGEPAIFGDHGGVISRIWLKHGRTKHALRLATQALSFQRKLLGKSPEDVRFVVWRGLDAPPRGPFKLLDVSSYPFYIMRAATVVGLFVLLT